MGSAGGSGGGGGSWRDLRSRPWRERLALITETMREISRHTDPQKMVEYYGERMGEFFEWDRFVSVSRRGLVHPEYMITRSSTWTQDVDPWKERHKLPRLRGGLLAELVYGDEPKMIDDLSVSPDDPAYEYLKGMRSLIATPHYDGGVGLNLVVTLRREPGAFDPEAFPENFWMSNLFGRATNTLVLSRQLREANAAMDREMKVVADIQRSLLPTVLPSLPTLELAAHYQTSKNAGGDYYDFFELPEGKLGILIADVAGHGTPAAVLMAILHAIAHLAPGENAAPAAMLRFLNSHLSAKYTGDGGTFVTAFYGVYDPATRRLSYSSAGHPHPLVVRCECTGVSLLDMAQGLPLGIDRNAAYVTGEHQLNAGDTLVLYTDGITEARGPGGRMYGEARLGAAVARCPQMAGPGATAACELRAILEDVEAFAAGHQATDDRTLVVGRVR